MDKKAKSMPPWRSAIQSKNRDIDEILKSLGWRLSDEQRRDLSPIQQPRITETIKEFLSPRELLITEKNACYLLGKLRLGQWTAQEVVHAFCHRAALAHQLVRHAPKSSVPKSIKREKRREDKLTFFFRPTVCLKCSSKRQSVRLLLLTSIS